MPKASCSTKKHWLYQFLQEADGSFSATRLVFLLWGLLVLVFWIVASCISLLKCGVMADIPSQVAYILAGLGIGKAIQKPFEKVVTPGSSSGVKLDDLNVIDPFTVK